MQRLKDRDLLSALVMLFIGGVAWWEAGSDLRNWVFPLMASYLVLGLGAMLLLRIVFSAAMNHVPDLIEWKPEFRPMTIDLLVFGAIVLAYMFVMYGLGFWLSSFLMLTAVSVYLTLEKTRRNLLLALIVPLGACVVAYIVFLHVFYVPLPDAKWWAGFR